MMNTEKINTKDYVVLYSLTKKRKWLVQVSDRKFSTDLGVVDLEKLIGKSYGEIITTSKGVKLKILKPTPFEYIMHSERPTQIVYPKDIGYLLIKLGVKSNSKVLEIGTGSGALTTGFAWFLGEEGEIKTFEKRREFMEVAMKNVMRIKPVCKIKFINQDFSDAEVEKEYYDIAFVDMDSPWKILGKVYDSLKPSGRVGILLPTYNQVDKIASKLKKHFLDIEAVEIFLRNIRVKKGMIRPEFQMIGYTAVVITGVKN